MEEVGRGEGIGRGRWRSSSRCHRGGFKPRNDEVNFVVLFKPLRHVQVMVRLLCRATARLMACSVADKTEHLHESGENPAQRTRTFDENKAAPMDLTSRCLVDCRDVPRPRPYSQLMASNQDSRWFDQGNKRHHPSLRVRGERGSISTMRVSTSATCRARAFITYISSNILNQ